MILATVKTENYDGKWIINEIISHHSCCDSDVKRKRNYSTKIMSTTNSVVSSFIQSKERLGIFTAIINMTKESDGIILKNLTPIMWFKTRHRIVYLFTFGNICC